MTRETNDWPRIYEGNVRKKEKKCLKLEEHSCTRFNNKSNCDESVKNLFGKSNRKLTEYQEYLINGHWKTSLDMITFSLPLILISYKRTACIPHWNDVETAGNLQNTVGVFVGTQLVAMIKSTTNLRLKNVYFMAGFYLFSAHHENIQRFVISIFKVKILCYFKKLKKLKII